MAKLNELQQEKQREIFSQAMHKGVMKEACEQMDIWNAWSSDIIDVMTAMPKSKKALEL